MRTLTQIWKPIIDELEQYLPQSVGGMLPGELCEVELGLTAFSDLYPGSPASWLCRLLQGYTFGIPALLNLTSAQRQALGIVRTILLPYKNEYVWRDQLGRYMSIEDRFRAFEVDDKYSAYHHKAVTVAAERDKLYAKILSSPLPYQHRDIQWASVGKTYICADQQHKVSVMIPGDIEPPPLPTGHSMHMRRKRDPFTIPIQALEETACWMDEQEQNLGLSNNWRNRLDRITLELSSDEHSGFTPARELPLNGIHNIVGIVSAGKSTLMDIIAVWSARNGRRITLVVGDVVDIFTRVRMFTRLGLKAAPIFGLSNREEHTNRLFRVLTMREEIHPLLLDPSWFKYTSSSCLLDGLRAGPTPFLMKPQPCLYLHQPSKHKKAHGEPEKKSYACPFFSVCPYHLAQRELVDAPIWIATPASLVYSRVAQQLNTESLTFLELACMRSDLIIVDEADRVQMQLDQVFSPSQTLMRKGRDSWLGYLLTHVNEQISLGGCHQVREEHVRKWSSVLNVASTALLSLYNLLQTELSLYSWLKADLDYFSPLTVIEKMSIELSGSVPSPGSSPFEDPEVQRIISAFSPFLDDPLAENESHELGLIAQEALVSTRARTRTKLRVWLEHLLPRLVGDPGIEEYTLRLHFALMLNILTYCLANLVNNWKQVEAILALEGSNNVLFHRPPQDYAPLIPDTPMGNILGFQYIPVDKSPQEAGELRFFRCMGIGRSLLLHMHELFDAYGFCGPHVVLLSGTSWAGTSPSYHIQLPVSGVLRIPPEDIRNIKKTTFELRLLKSQLRQEILHLSGQRPGQDSVKALEEMLDALSHRDRFASSILEQECSTLPKDRQRILILVGSYPEARRAYEYLAQKREDWKEKMKYLVPDDENFECEWRGFDPRIQRGIVSRFGSSDAWLLIAPLMAVERGHNILNDQQIAALGAAFFLKRPHPRPNDISYHIHCMNHWAVKYGDDYRWLTAKNQKQPPSLLTISETFHREAYHEWRRLLHLPLIQKTMLEGDKRSLVWSQLVSIWQVIGRLLRGGCPARVIFCDASFAEVTREEQPHICGGPLWEMLQELSPYFDAHPSPHISHSEKALVRILYEPLYNALKNITVQ